MADSNSLMTPANLAEWLALSNVLLTAIFAGLTFFILRANRAAVAAMRDQLADQNRPYVHVSVQVRMGTQVLQLLVKNVGRSPAQDLRLHIDRDFHQFGDKSEARNLAKQSAFTNPIDCLPPMSELPISAPAPAFLVMRLIRRNVHRHSPCRQSINTARSTTARKHTSTCGRIWVPAFLIIR